MSSPARDRGPEEGHGDAFGPMDGAAPERTPERAPEALEPSGEDCEACGTQMYGLHCKLVCPNCGYRRDCSDP